jgi:small-conductance mechanosensitive channel
MKMLEMLKHYGFILMKPSLIVVSVLLAGFIARRILFSFLAQWTKKTAGQLDDIIVAALRAPFLIWVLMLGIHFAAQYSPLPQTISGNISKILFVLLIISLTAVGSKLANEIVKLYGTKIQGALPVTSLTQNLARLAVIIIGLLILLNFLNISIAPLLTALGVGGLAVALGLQDTLANFFAGFYVSVAGYVRRGDYVKLNSGEEGYVTDIHWRSTTIKGLSNNLIIVPNSHLAKAIVTNYNLPEKRISFTIPVGVSYDCDPDNVESILMEEALAGVGEIPGLLGIPAPSVRFNPGFGDSSLNFSITCHVEEFVKQFGVQHELRKRIFKRLRKENIEMPFPTRTVYIREER